jgi:outer membrane protein TolC
LRAGTLPQLTITSAAGWSNRYDETFTALADDGQFREFPLASLGQDRGFFNVYLSQVLFDLEHWLLLDREELAAEAAALQEARQRDDVAFEVTRRFAQLLRLERRAELAGQQLAQAQWLAEQAEARLGAGRALAVEGALASLHREGLELERQAAALERATAEAELWIAVGEGDEPAGSLELVAESLPAPERVPSAGQVAELVSAAPELRVLDLQRRMEERAVDAARADRLPKLKLVTGYSHYGIKRFDTYDDELWVGVDVQIPIFDGFHADHSVRGAEQGAAIARLRYDAALQSKQTQARDLLQRLETGRQRLALADRRAQAAAERQRLADLSLRAERGSLDAALAAREERARLEAEALDARFAQLELWASLQRELGRLASELAASPAPAVAP